MKEKTFEELFYDRIGNFDTQHHELIEKWEFIKFCKQVREETIEECLQLALKETISMSRKSQFDLIPTNRIKLL